MQSNRPVLNKLFAVRRDMLRGDSLFAVIIFAVVALFLFNLVASVWRNMVFQQDIEARSQRSRDGSRRRGAGQGGRVPHGGQ